MSTRKLFIVAPDRPDLLASLRRAIGHEPGIEIFHDRRARDANAPRAQGDRRERPEVTAQMGERGFAVVTLAAATASRFSHRRGG